MQSLGYSHAPNSLGAYSCLISTGTMAAGLGAAAPIFSFRWTDATGKLAIIRSVTIDQMSLGTGFTAGRGFFDIIVARSFSASDTGGAPATLTTNNAKRRTSLATSLVGDFRVSTTATLTAGTRTLDAQAMSAIQFGITATTNTVFLPTTALLLPSGRALGTDSWPLVLAQNEGFIIRATVPATGTWQSDIAVDWEEVSSY